MCRLLWGREPGVQRRGDPDHRLAGGPSEPHPGHESAGRNEVCGAHPLLLQASAETFERREEPPDWGQEETPGAKPDASHTTLQTPRRREAGGPAQRPRRSQEFTPVRERCSPLKSGRRQGCFSPSCPCKDSGQRIPCKAQSVGCPLGGRGCPFLDTDGIGGPSICRGVGETSTDWSPVMYYRLPISGPRQLF